MSARYDVAVVGAGVFGLAAALELCRRGRKVAVFDRLGGGHPLTSSTGRSRGIRIAYDHPFYVELAQRAIREWRRLEEQSGRTLLHLTGQVDFGLSGKLEKIVAAMRETGAAIEELDGAGLARHFPGLRVAPGESGLFHTQAGTVLADEGMAALRAAALSAGAEVFEPERVTGIESGLAVRIETERRTLSAETLVIAAGPWSGELLAGLGLPVPLAPAVAQVTFIRAPGHVGWPGIGEWGGDSDGKGGVYGHPVPGIGYKLAFSSGQDGWSAAASEWPPDGKEQARLLRWLDRRLPAFPREVVLTQRHPWTMTPDGDFVLDRLGPFVMACGCSGHAFKFGPALGPLVADLVEGKPPHPLFRRDRPALTQAAHASATITR